MVHWQECLAQGHQGRRRGWAQCRRASRTVSPRRHKQAVGMVCIVLKRNAAVNCPECFSRTFLQNVGRSTCQHVMPGPFLSTQLPILQDKCSDECHARTQFYVAVGKSLLCVAILASLASLRVAKNGSVVGRE